MSHPEQLYHQPDTAYRPAPDYADLVRPRLPRHWRLHAGPVWTQAFGPRPARRTQGWKIHVSATLEDAHRALEAVTELAPRLDTEFKFSSDPTRHLRLLSKNIARQTGGKFITLYPPSDEVFTRLLELLYPVCSDLRGPYILSDTPYKESSVLFYRYGGFQNFSDIDVFHERRSLVLDQSYRFVEDRRLPSVVVPPFASTPSFVAVPHAPSVSGLSGNDSSANAPGTATDQAPEGPILLNERFEILGALKQSNIGGVYLARDRDGSQVVLREARPFTDPDIHGQDAVVRLRREYAILQSINGLGIAPPAIDCFEAWTHTFLAIGHVPGRSLRQLIVSQGATLHTQSDAQALRDWFELAHDVAVDLIVKIQALHAAGIVYGDVSTNNVIVDLQTRRFTLIDFETAFRPAVDQGHNAFTPGYAFSERLHRGIAEWRDDIIGAGATMLAMLCPNACNLPLVPGFPDRVLDSLELDFGLDPAYGAAARRLLTGDAQSLDDALRLLRGSEPHRAHALSARPRNAERVALVGLLAELRAFLQDHVDLTLPDPLFGLDPGREDHVLAFDHGLAGIAFAQCRLTLAQGPALARHVAARLAKGAETPGLLNGLAGGAWACMEAGEHAAAARLLDQCDDHRLLYADASLGYGLAGVGLASLRLWRQTGSEQAMARVHHIAATLLEDARTGDGTACWPANGGDDPRPLRVGLHGGAAGIALFLGYAHAATGRPAWLDMALAALRHDLRFERAVGVSVGFPKVAQGGEAGILYPYLEVGTAGLVSVALRLHRLSGDASLETFIHRALPTVAQRYTVCAGMGPGLAGLAHCLLDAAEFLDQPHYAELACRTAGALNQFRVPLGAGACTPARLGGTVSATYQDGGAGVALLLQRLLEGTGPFHFNLDEVLPPMRRSSPSCR